MKLNPYLFFNGDCEEALNFYKDILHGEIASMNYFEGSPMEVPKEYEKKVMHAELRFGDNTIYASDGHPEQPKQAAGNITLSIGMDNPDDMDQYFNALSEGGQVMMPLEETFWGAKFGMFTDRFGISWMFDCDLNK